MAMYTEFTMTRSILLIAVILQFVAFISFAQDGPCTCDLTLSACDPNCCCDLDCNATDIAAFSGCSNNYSFSTVQSCFPSSIMFRNYTPYSVNTSSGDGLACIYYDRFTARNYYTNPQVNANSSTISLKAQAFAGFNFSATTPGTDYSVYGDSYKAGNPVHILYAGAQPPGYLRQPAASNSPQCSYSVPALFMASGASACSRRVTVASCAADLGLQLASFVQGFRIVPQPGRFTSNSSDALNYANLTELSQGSLVCRNASGDSIACPDALPSPSLAAGVCSNVLTSLTYNIKYLASSGGIYEASYNAELGAYNVSSGSFTLKQTFTAAYNLSSSAAAAATAYPRSGNPGYLVGKPVLAGTRNLTTSSVQVDANPELWLTVPGASADGACNFAAATAAGRRSVAFGETLQSNCWLNLTAGSATACASLEASVFASLAGLGGGAASDTVVVGSFGNTAATGLAGWVPVHVDNATCRGVSVRQLATGCVDLLLGGRLDLVTARTGSVANPQSSVLGARLQCVRGNVTFQCSGGSCSSGSSAATQRFLASYAVNFIDASATPTSGTTAPSSSFQWRLGRDFFYLLYVENGADRAAPAAAIGWRLCPLLLLCLVAPHWLA